MDPLGAMALAGPAETDQASIFTSLRSMILATQYLSESRHTIDLIPPAKSAAFPQAELLRLRGICELFPPPSSLARVLTLDSCTRRSKLGVCLRVRSKNLELGLN